MLSRPKCGASLSYRVCTSDLNIVTYSLIASSLRDDLDEKRAQVLYRSESGCNRVTYVCDERCMAAVCMLTVDL
jgi:hypothetical protein